MATKNDDWSFDFGFSTVSEEELEQLTMQAVEDGVKQAETRLKGQIEDAEKTIEYYQNKMVKLEKMLIPFLNNLASNPEKTYLYWPNRQPKILQFKQMLLDELRE